MRSMAAPEGPSGHMGPSPTSLSSWRARDPSEKSRQKNGAFKKFEERPDILASRRFLARIAERADRHTTATVS
jgi:hypothetical protein